MKKKISFLAVLAFMLSGMVLGCGTKTSEIVRLSQSQRSDVFTEISISGEVPAGSADLIIRANIKTHAEGYYAFESKDSLHGRPGYPFLVNIDGQAVTWKVGGVKDVKPKYDKDGKTSLDPEAGEGVLYQLEKTLRLKVGAYKIYFSLPEDPYLLDAEITVRDGAQHVMELKPIYSYKTVPTRIETFLKGISRYEVYLDGKRIY